MGRGRAKAKQTKVARELKYHSPATDYKALERELSAGEADEEPDSPPRDDGASAGYDEYEEKYADPYGDEDEDSRKDS